MALEPKTQGELSQLLADESGINPIVISVREGAAKGSFVATESSLVPLLLVVASLRRGLTPSASNCA